jgi:hypothetical protein
VGGESRRLMGRVVEGTGRPEIARLDHSQTHRAVVRVQLRLPIARRPAIRVMGDDDVPAVPAG